MDRLDMCEAVKLHRVPFVLNPSGEWARFPEHLKCFVEQPWTEFKYFVDGTNQINPAIANVPNNCGGVYIFLIKPNVISDIHLYLAYMVPSRFMRKKICRLRLSEVSRQ